MQAPDDEADAEMEAEAMDVAEGEKTAMGVGEDGREGPRALYVSLPSLLTIS